MQHLRPSVLVSALAAAALAVACGGSSSSKPPATPGPSAGGAAKPFDEEAVRAAIAATPWSSAPACGDPEDVNATLADLYRQQGSEQAGRTNVFNCQPHGAGDGRWQCTWSTLDQPGAPDPDDPCAEQGMSGFQIIVDVSASGAIDTESIICYAPG